MDVQKRADELFGKLEAPGGNIRTAMLSDADAEELSILIEETEWYPRHYRTSADALVLYARLHRLVFLMEPAVFGNTAAGSRDGFDRVIRALDQALIVAPDNAEAHYWRARMLALRLPVSRDGQVLFESVDMPEAINAARRAVNLSSENGEFRVALATFLIESGKEDEALDVISGIRGGKHPIARLLKQWDALPVPQNAVPLERDAQGVAAQQMSLGQFGDYPGLRVRFFLVPAHRSEIEAFYGEKWPGFKLFPAESDPNQVRDDQLRVYQQYLAQKRGHLVPTAKASKLPERPKNGIVMAVTELRRPPEALRTASGGDRVDDGSRSGVFCYLVMINYAS